MTLATEFVPGTNLSGGLACADWRYLLPRLHLEKVLFLGVPTAATLSVLSTIGDRIFVASPDHSSLRRLHRAARQYGITHLHAVSLQGFASLPFSNRAMDLILLTDSNGQVKPVRSPGLISELDRILKSDGVVYFEVKGLIDNFLGWQAIRSFSSRKAGYSQVFWLTPRNGEMRTALPLKDRQIARHFFEHVIYGLSLKERALSRIGGVLSRLSLIWHIVLRRAVVVHRSPMNGHSKHPPQYLVSLARKAGIDLANHRCGVSARGRHNSNKVVFYLFEDPGKIPDTIIKMTRAPEFNYRLANEFNVLSLLTEGRFVDPTTFPKPLFLDYHNNLAVLGEKAVRGFPFRMRTEATPRCPVARDAINWIVRLGIASSGKTLATPGQVSAALRKLLDRYIHIYNPPDAEATFLEGQIRALGQSRSPFPLVFQHGDPGTWNVMVLESGRAAFIDWEAGEPQGMPLWDLFYFARSYGRWISRTEGADDALDSFAKHFLELSGLGSLLAETVARYCMDVGVEASAIEPLFYTCWMHRALKECTRLPMASLPSGHYVNLLRLCIERRASPGLRRLLAGV